MCEFDAAKLGSGRTGITAQAQSSQRKARAKVQHKWAQRKAEDAEKGIEDAENGQNYGRDATD